MITFLVLYLLIALAVVAIGVVVVLGQRAAAHKNRHDGSGHPPPNRA